MDYMDQIENISHLWKDSTFIKTYSVAITRVKEDSSIVIDTRELEIRRKNTLEEAYGKIERLKKIKEASSDRRIRYKEKIIKDLEEYASALENEFKFGIVILAENSLDRFERVKAVAMPKALKIKAVQKETLKAQTLYIEKYTYKL